MQIFFFLAIFLVVVAIILSLQNMVVGTIAVFLWNVHTSLAWVLLAALGVGFLIGLLLLLPGSIRNKWNASSQKKKLAALEDERDKLQKKSEESDKEIATLEEQLASFSAALEERQTNESASSNQAPTTSEQPGK